MLKNNRLLTSLNSGTVTIYAEATVPSSFGAKTNARSLADMDKVCTLAYKTRACRDQDYEAAERIGYALSKKVQTYNVGNVKPEHKAVINDVLYDIGAIDRDARYMYIYLSGGEQL